MKCFLVIFLCTWASLLQAQQIKPFEKVAFDSGSDDFTILGTYQNKTALFLYHNSKAEIVLFDSVGKKDATIPLPAYEKNCGNIHFQCTANNLCAYFEKKEKQTYTLLACTLRADQTFSDPKPIGSYEYHFLKDRNEYQFAISHDQSKVLFYTYTPAEEDFALQAIVVNDQLEVLTDVKQLLPKNETRFLFQHEVGNNGTAQILISADLDKKGGTADVTLMSCRSGRNAFSFRRLPQGQRYLHDIRLFIDDDGQINHLTGFYCDAKYGPVKGIYHCEAGANLMEDLSGYYIPLSIRGGKTKLDFKDLSTVRISLMKDGGLEIITERSYKVQTGGSSTMMMTTGVLSMPSPGMNALSPTTQFHNEEISIFNLKRENTLRWSQTVLKDQVSTEDEGLSSSFACMESQLGKVYIYNELNGRNNRLMASYVSSKGAITLKEIELGLKDEDRYAVYTRFSYQLNANELLMPSLYKGYLCLLRLHF